MTSVWPVVHAERAALIEFLGSLDTAQWETPSLCGDWTVHDVAAHLVDTAKATPVRFLCTLAAARFDFDRENANGVAREKAATPAQTLARLRAVVHRTSSPPAPRVTRLVEAIVHGEDIRRPLGAAHKYPLEATVRALRSQASTTTSFGGGKERIAGLTMEASDAGISIGDGPTVTGTALALLLAVSGRSVALADLSGPGVPQLTRQISGL